VQERAEDDDHRDDVDGRHAEHHGERRLIAVAMPSSPSRRRSARLGARVAAGAAVLAALTLAACGGDGGGAAPGTTAAPAPASTAAAGAPLSHAQLVAQADAACAKASKAIAGVPAARSLSALAGYASRVQAIGNDLHDALGALRPAAADRAAYAKYVDGVRASNAALDALRTAAQNADADGVRAAARSIDDVAVGVLATRAGLPGCAATTSGAGS